MQTMATFEELQRAADIAELDPYFTRDNRQLDALVADARLLLPLSDATALWAIQGQRITEGLTTGVVSPVHVSSLLSAAIMRLAAMPSPADDGLGGG